jgi:hypothetical protein
MLMASRAPKKLWDHVIELHCLLMSHISNETLILNGEVPETFMTDETADISQISEFEFYQWVMFRDSTAPFPEDDKILGRGWVRLLILALPCQPRPRFSSPTGK